MGDGAGWFAASSVAELRKDLPPALVRLNTGVSVPVRPAPANSTRFGLQTTGGYVNRVAFGDETLWRRPAAAVP